MTDRLTPGQLRDLADVVQSFDTLLAANLRREAARREAVDFGEHGKCVEADKPCESDRCLTDRECYAPPPPADDLVARLRQYRGKSWEVTECYNGLRDEAAAAIEALRADLAESAHVISRWSEMYAEMETRAEAAEAREKALEGLLDKYRAGIVTHVQMNGPVFGGANSRQLKIAFEADQALAAGGGNG